MPGEEMTPEELKVLALRMEDRAFDERVVAELARAPDLSTSIPAGFAARVVSHLPAKRAVAASVDSIRQTHYGWRVMRFCLILLLIAVVVIALRGSTQSIAGRTIEWTVCAQFLALAIWLSVRRRTAG